MNLEKSKLKVLILNNLGADIEDKLDSEVKTTYELLGGSDALKQAAYKIPRDLAAKLDKAIKENELAETYTTLEAAELVKKYLTKVQDYLLHIAETEKFKSTTQKGCVNGLRSAMDIVQKQKLDEAKKIEQILSILDNKDETILPGTDIRTSNEMAIVANGTLEERREQAKQTKFVGKKVKIKKKNLPKKVIQRESDGADNR